MSTPSVSIDEQSSMLYSKAAPVIGIKKTEDPRSIWTGTKTLLLMFLLLLVVVIYAYVDISSALLSCDQCAKPILWYPIFTGAWAILFEFDWTVTSFALNLSLLYQPDIYIGFVYCVQLLRGAETVFIRCLIEHAAVRPYDCILQHGV